MLTALGSQGVEAVMTRDGATAAEVFRGAIAPGLGPTLRAGAIVVMDNLRAHKTAGIREAMDQPGAWWRYLPPYSPDLSPIARCWSKLKTTLRTAKARIREALAQAIARPWPPSPSLTPAVDTTMVDMPDGDVKTALGSSPIAQRRFRPHLLRPLVVEVMLIPRPAGEDTPPALKRAEQY
jgi:transposase